MIPNRIVQDVKELRNKVLGIYSGLIWTNYGNPRKPISCLSPTVWRRSTQHQLPWCRREAPTYAKELSEEADKIEKRFKKLCQFWDTQMAVLSNNRFARLVKVSEEGEDTEDCVRKALHDIKKMLENIV